MNKKYLTKKQVFRDYTGLQEKKRYFFNLKRKGLARILNRVEITVFKCPPYGYNTKLGGR